MLLLIFMKWSINWQYRMSLATCYDPTGDEWLTYEWIMCDQSGGNGMCTPAGYSCWDGATTADRCPLDYGGSGDGCQPPNLIRTFIDTALNPGTVDEPMYEKQAQIQNRFLRYTFASVLLVAFFLSQQVHEPSVVVASEDDDEEGEEGHGEEEEEHDFGELSTLSINVFK